MLCQATVATASMDLLQVLYMSATCYFQHLGRNGIRMCTLRSSGRPFCSSCH